MPVALRSPAHPEGLPDLPPREHALLQLSNKLAQAAGHVLRLAVAARIPCGEEKPATSFLWLRPDRMHMQQSSSCSSYRIDYCAFGTPWRARTRLNVMHCMHDPKLAQKQCHGRGICSFTGRPHEVLSGASRGSFLTKQKKPYPPRLCRALAKLLTGYAINRCSTSLWNRFKGCQNTA